jgi:tetratricopeptide (TPR) repeat protein
MKPTDGIINKMLARTFYEVKHYPKAIEQYKIAEKALPKDLDLPFKLGFCYRKINNYGEAMRSFLRAMDLDPSNGSKAYEAANSCYDANNYKLALELYQRAEDKGHYKSKGFYDNWALTCIELKDYDKALFYYTQAKEFSPYDKDINLSIAETYMKKGDFNKCREVLDDMLQLNPNDAEVIYTKGMTYYKAGNTSKAETFFNQAFNIDPSLKSLRYTKSNL